MQSKTANLGADMKKRRYITNMKRQKLIDEAMSTAREARQAIDPELLENVRNAIGAAVESYESERYKVIHSERVPVDMKKNLSVVMKYMELCPDHTAVQQEIRSFLTAH